MKNKEIEKSIKRIKEIVDFYKLNDENNYDYSDDVLISMKNLLLYIEQLENNRDKALKKLNKYRNRKDHYGLWCMEYIDNADIIHILKGDSDNEQR